MKRFTDTERFHDPWYRKLSPELKCFWEYLCARCDHAGLWEPDIETASYFIGAPIDGPKALIAFHGRIETLPSGKWRVVKFVKFQYGQLSRSCKPHNPIFACIERHGYQIEAFENGTFLFPSDSKGIETLSLGFESLQEKDKEKDKDKVKDKTAKIFTPPTPEEIEQYSAEIGYPLNGQAWCDCYAQKGWMVGKSKMKEWKAAVRNWKANGWLPNGSAARNEGEFANAW